MVKRDKVLLFAGSVFASIYLTFIVDVYTLNTWPKRIFVFCYFLIMCHAAIFLKRKFLKDKQLPKHMLAIVGLLAAAVVVLGHNTFFPKAQETTVSLAAVPCEDGSYHEVWLTSMQVDGQEVQLSQLELDADQGWTYSGDYDDYVFYPTDGTDNTNYLTFEATGESIELTFAKNAWSGAVEVRAQDQQGSMCSLNNEGSGTYDYTINTQRSYSKVEYLLYGIGVWCIIAVLLHSLLVWFFTKKVFSTNKNLPWLCIVASIIIGETYYLSSNMQVFFQPEWFHVSISVTGEKNINCKGNEVWIRLPNKAENVEYTPGWEMRNGGYLCTSADQIISFDCLSNEAEIAASYHPYAAMISIAYGNKTEVIDLYSEEDEGITPILLDVEPHLRALPEVTVIVISTFVTMACALILVSLIAPKHRFAPIFMTAVLCALSAAQEDGSSWLIGFVLLSVASYFFMYINQKSSNRAVQEYTSNRYLCVFVGIVAAYSVFACFGYSLFLSGLEATFTVSNILLFSLLTVLAVPILLGSIVAVDKLSSHFYSESIVTSKKRNCASAIYFAVISIGTVIWCLIFSPANMTPDNVDQWFQAVGIERINDAHPALHTLFIRLCAYIYPSPLSTTIVQSLIYAFVVASILTWLNQRGLKRRAAVMICLIIVLLPNHIMMLTCPSKNILFGILMLWLTYLLMRMIDKPKEFFNSYSLMGQLIVVAACTHIVRKNAFVILPVVAVIAILLTMFQFRNIHFRAIICAGLSVALMYVITGPVYNFFDVYRPDVSDASIDVLMEPYPALLKSGKDLDEDTLTFLEKLLPIDEYVRRYSPYNRDILRWSEPRPKYENVSITESLHYYLKTLQKYPVSVIKSRLDGVNLLWDVKSHPGVRHDCYAAGIWGGISENYKWFPDVFMEQRKIEDGHYDVGDLAKKEMIYVQAAGALLDTLVWRNGMYVILMLFMALMAVKKQRADILVGILIPFLILGTLALVAGWQIYQYYWFFPQCMVCVLGTLVTHQPQKTSG